MINTDLDWLGRPDLLDVVTEALTSYDPEIMLVETFAQHVTDRLLADGACAEYLLPSVDVSTRTGHVTIPVARLDRIYLQTTDPTQNSVPMDAHGIEERCEMLYAERPRPLPGDRPLATGGIITDPPVLTAERGCEVTDLPPGNRVFVGPGGQLDLDNAFTYHPPKPDQIARYGALRGSGRTLAEKIAEFCPPSPERSTAIAKVREAIMWANASIACNEPPAEKIADADSSLPLPTTKGRKP